MNDNIEKKETITIFSRFPKSTIVSFIFLVSILIDLIAARIFNPRDYNAYRIPNQYYHHGFMPNTSSLSSWGGEIIPIYTNSLGFIDKGVREVPLETSKFRIVIIGDSFAEGRGVFYTKTFPGIIEQALSGNGFDVLNASVSSYSPKLYYLKIKYLIEEVKLKFNELIVFIDISDIQDELLYEKFEPSEIPFRILFMYNITKYFERNSFTYYSLMRIQKNYQPGMEYDQNIFPQLNESYKYISSPEFKKERELWTLNSETYEKIGKRGLQLAEKNMDKLYRLCLENNIKLVISVYPWPAQIAYRDLNSVQEQFWKFFCSQRNIKFIDLFPLFINQDNPKEIYLKYYINGDVHWNPDGHKLVAQKVLESFYTTKIVE